MKEIDQILQSQLNDIKDKGTYVIKSSMTPLRNGQLVKVSQKTNTANKLN